MRIRRLKPSHRIRNKSQKARYSFLKIFTGSDLSRRHLPVMEIKSVNPGPVLWLTGCSHGDEVGGMVIIQEIFKRINKKGLLKGSLYAFPLMNPIGFDNVSRDITLSEEDLNRAFPGDKEGSLAQRIAYQIFNHIKETKPDLVLDLHNDWINSIPHTLIDMDLGPEHKDVYEKTKSFARKTGFLVVLDMDDLKTALSYNLIKNKIPALTLEIGEPYVVNETDVDSGVDCILNILSEMGMIEPIGELVKHPILIKEPELNDKILKFSSKPVSSSSGIIRFLSEPGDVVIKGQPVARIYNSFGKLQENVVTLKKAVVLGHSDSSVAFPGAAVMSFGVIED
ncbi:MAG: succinylglutamate desuccinylase/aspartoacylase family protein [Candidatus Nanoarchaeia archaeon]|nr:succinylglutamate desuccinylase/aspartoacylase family protein [Candidatus Nanoarchaeia archaeon]